eukprot:CAMPEP_0172489564 /NCGR_PEP_ID=MMETSP1066-20121228/19648_1 /TAXON_ID=671091 /ORGANISM="Coscinodiscus wailesii, Strain CCMP2513" /LENGTH=164 /DNA_ID=CAMNT_0013257519 /DNA_START=50 /DNA_END=541 /DNA_ORIENTATION=-
MTKRRFAIIALVVPTLLPSFLASPLTNPHTNINTLPLPTNIITTTTTSQTPPSSLTTEEDPRCPYSLHPRIPPSYYTSSFSSDHRPVITSPHVVTTTPYGTKVIYLQNEHLHAVNGATLAPSPVDFPLLFEGSYFVASPLSYDVDGDGVDDAILVDYDGRVFVA